MRVIVSLIFASILFLSLLCSANPHTCAGQESNIRISFIHEDKEKYSFGADATYENFFFTYGETVTFLCSGSDHHNLAIYVTTDKEDTDRRIQPTDFFNMTSRKMTVENHGIGVYLYTCADAKTNCAVSFIVGVYPLVTVVSPNFRRIQISFNKALQGKYFVPLNEDYEVVCLGNLPLKMIMNGDEMEIISVNTTAIKSVKQNDKTPQHFYYECTHVDSRLPTSFYPLTTKIMLYVDNIDPPSADDFWCIEFHLQINCTWDVQYVPSAMDTNYKLFYIDRYNKSILLHAYRKRSKKTARKKSWRCEWSLESVTQYGLQYNNNISLQLQACRYYNCVTQTYQIDRPSILKSAAPVGLEVAKTDSQKAVVMWKHNEDYPVEYNITHRLPGSEWMQKLNASSEENCDGKSCEMELKLPCPGVLYEFKVYVKSMTAPQKTTYWSDPASILFHTDPQDNNDGVDPMCYEEPESIVNKYVGEYKVKELRREFIKDGSTLFGDIQSMKRKLDSIKTICRELSLGDCDHRAGYTLL